MLKVSSIQHIDILLWRMMTYCQARPSWHNLLATSSAEVVSSILDKTRDFLKIVASVAESVRT